MKLCDEFHYPTSFFDFFLGTGRDEACFYDAWKLGDKSVTENLGVPCSKYINYWYNIGAFGETVLLLLWYQSPELVNIDRTAPVCVFGKVEVPHTNLTEVTRMVLIEVGSVVVSTTSETATSRMLAVLAYTTVTGGDVSSVLASLGKVGRHFSFEA